MQRRRLSCDAECSTSGQSPGVRVIHHAAGATARVWQRTGRPVPVVHAAKGTTTSTTSQPPSYDHTASNFDLSLAVALAAAAFEAYLEPTGGAGFEETSVNGTRTSYIDK